MAPTTVAGQAVRFLFVGGLATVVDVGLFNVLHVLAGADPIAAKGVSTLAGAVVAFIGNRQWAFAARQSLPVRRQVLRYVLVNLAALGLALVPIPLTRDVLGLDGVVAMNVAANVVGLGMATVFRFAGYRRWVFVPERRRDHAVRPIARPMSG